MKRVVMGILSLLVLFHSYITIVKANESSVKYNFSVLFLPKTCDVNTPDEIILGNQSGVTTLNEIRNDTVEKDITISLVNCSNQDQSEALVYLSSGNHLTGSKNFFNDDPDGVIGVQLLDGDRIISLNENTLSKPSANSIIWENMTNTSATKNIKAKLRCVKDNCDPKEGDFSATLTLGYYAD